MLGFFCTNVSRIKASVHVLAAAQNPNLSCRRQVLRFIKCRSLPRCNLSRFRQLQSLYTVSTLLSVIMSFSKPRSFSSLLQLFCVVLAVVHPCAGSPTHGNRHSASHLSTRQVQCPSQLLVDEPLTPNAANKKPRALYPASSSETNPTSRKPSTSTPTSTASAPGKTPQCQPSSTPATPSPSNST